MRIGAGYDVHRLVPDRKLVLGGVRIPFEKGLEGHSDADAVLHSICDALLGAAGLGDIGLHFPDSDPSYKNIDSAVLLRRVREAVEKKALAVCNIDITIFAQEPKLAPYREKMEKRIAEILGIEADRVNVKATTTEGLGPFGRGEGIAAASVALLGKPPPAKKQSKERARKDFL
jgi:2-C-methyl-D-erythritol 2,4-cyclodiphosphate synthase